MRLSFGLLSNEYVSNASIQCDWFRITTELALDKYIEEMRPTHNQRPFCVSPCLPQGCTLFTAVSGVWIHGALVAILLALCS